LFRVALVARKNEDHFDFTDATMQNQKLKQRLATVLKNFFFYLEQRKKLLFFSKQKPNALYW